MDVIDALKSPSRLGASPPTSIPSKPNLAIGAAIASLKGLGAPFVVASRSPTEPAISMGASRQTALRSKRSWSPVASPSRRPLRFATSVSRPRLLLTTRNRPFDRLKLGKGAKAPATLPGPTDPSARAKGGRSMSSVAVGLTRTARMGTKRPRSNSIRERSRRPLGAETTLAPSASSSRASIRWRLGQGSAEKLADPGPRQCRRGKAPNAALRLSPTFGADSGQRVNPHNPSAAINAAAQPNATARRMCSASPSSRPQTTGRAAEGL